jgi:diacylglycerol kinase (ATP)
MLSGLMERSDPRPALAIIPAGTGNDIARAIGVPTVEDAVAALRGEQTRLFDLIRIDCQSDGRPVRRHALLLGTVGFSPAVLDTVKPWMKRLLGPRGAYYLGMLLAVIIYELPDMVVRRDDGDFRGRSWIVIAANAERVAGGSIRIAPGARMDDGELNITIVPERSKLNFILKMMGKMSTGEHVNEPGIQYFRTANIRVESDPPAGLEIDGNPFGYTPATFTVSPRAARIVCPTSDGIDDARPRGAS